MYEPGEVYVAATANGVGTDYKTEKNIVVLLSAVRQKPRLRT